MDRLRAMIFELYYQNFVIIEKFIAGMRLIFI